MEDDVEELEDQGLEDEELADRAARRRPPRGGVLRVLGPLLRLLLSRRRRVGGPGRERG